MPARTLRFLTSFQLAALLLAPAVTADEPAVLIAEPVRTVLAADADRTVIQVTFPVLTAVGDWRAVRKVTWQGICTEQVNPVTAEVEPIAALLGFHVAIGKRAVPTWRVAAQQWHRPPTDATRPVAAVHPPLIHRGVPLAPVEIFPEAGGGILAGLIIEIQHPAPAGFAKAAADPWLQRRAAQEPLPGSLANPAHYRDLSAWSLAQPPARGRTLPDYFALTDNWVRLEVAADGVYAVSGQQLELLGVNLAGIDPNKLRLFQGGGLPLDPDPELADSEQADRVGLTEIAIAVEALAANELHADDRLLFYALGPDVWLDRLVPGAEPLAHFNHPFENRGVYWLTWESLQVPSPFAGEPRRIGPPQDAQPTGAELRTTHRARYHGEQNLIYLGGLVRDDWVWQSYISTSFTTSFALQGVIPGAQADWQVDFCGIRVDSFPVFLRQIQTTAWLNSDSQTGAVSRTWTMYADQFNQERLRISGTTTSLQNGNNTIRLRHDNYAQNGIHLAFDSFDLFYDATLDKREYAGALCSVFWGDEIQEPATEHDVRYTLPASGQMRLWDITTPAAAFALSGVEAAETPRTLTISLRRDPGQTRHLILFAEGDLLSPSAARAVSVRPLRQQTLAADYIVIHPAAFTTAAERLAALRSRTLPGVESPAAVAVSLEDIYANFSGGRKDWRAIRQYLRWHFYELPDGQRLRWVCLLGDASRDYRNYLGRNPATGLVDWVPSDVATIFPGSFVTESTSYPYATDESLVALDAPLSPSIGFDIPDLAVGRLPANSAAGALSLVDRVAAFAEDLPPGSWRNHVVLCADDMLRPQGPVQTENRHMRQAERLANRYLAPAVEVAKVYLDEYPLVGQTKPEARRALLRQLDAGTTLFYFVGHGAAQVLADEQVFLSDFIPGLSNGGRRFAFVAFSCDVGVFDDPGGQSMGEMFLTASQGGGIASVAASWVSWSNHNDPLSDGFFDALYPQRRIDPGVTLGRALIDGKISIWTSIDRVRNARRFNLFGDPALRLPHPTDDLLFSADSADSLLTGRLHTVQVDLAGGTSQLDSDVEYELLVQDSAAAVSYSILPDSTWLRPGNTVFRGTGRLVGDEPQVLFLAPLNLRVGDLGRIRLMASDGQRDQVAFLQVPVRQVAAATGGDVNGPDIRLRFADGRVRVQPGAQLTATLQDTNGINILASSPANSVLLEFDDSGIYQNVSSAVVFEPGSYTRASLVTALPADLALGQHTVVMTASDMFNNVGNDTLRFYLEASGVAAIYDVAVFPNPTPGPCRLVCDLAAPMDLRWDIYTVAGRRLRSLREHFAAGPAVIHWDGRDGEGDEIANGVYLFVLRGAMAGSGHEIRETGQLVIMR